MVTGRMTPGARHAIAVLLVIGIAYAAATLFVGSATVNRLQREVHAQCKFDRDLGTVPVTVSPATHTASKLGVTIVSDARQGWRGLACPGMLPPPKPSFVKWARFYHLPAN